MAAEQAEAILTQLGQAEAPINLHAVADSETPLLILRSGDYRDKFDGQLEYHRSHRRFLLFYNTKLDRDGPGGIHPRTRFSLAHELGHYFIERHRDYLVRGGFAHGSRAEFQSHQEIEREADTFAASLLMPSGLMRPMVNRAELSLKIIGRIAEEFGTSWVCTAIRAVQLSHFPCLVALIRDGVIIWSRSSVALRDAGCYAGQSCSAPSRGAAQAYRRMLRGEVRPMGADGTLDPWVTTYGRDDLSEIQVYEEYRPVPSMGMLVVLVTADEADLDEIESEDRD